MSIEESPQDTELNNESEKRFTLSNEEFAQERIEAVKDSVDELKERDQAVLSFCMFGSMVKGTVRQESDIDGYLFVDADAVAEKYQQQNEKVEVIENEEKESGVETFFTREIESQYATEIRETLKLKANLNPEQVEHVRIRPISEQIIDQHTQSIIDGFHKEEEYENQFRQWEEENPEGKTTDLKKLTEYYKDRPKRPEPMIPSSTLISMFHLEVGGGIRKYRGSLISKLESMGEEGEKAWGEIIKGVEMLEQNLMSGTDKKYPRTLSEARSMYGTKK